MVNADCKIQNKIKSLHVARRAYAVRKFGVVAKGSGLGLGYGRPLRMGKLPY